MTVVCKNVADRNALLRVGRRPLAQIAIKGFDAATERLSIVDLPVQQDDGDGRYTLVPLYRSAAARSFAFGAGGFKSAAASLALSRALSWIFS
jgi:hypothetical protein